MLSDHPHRSNWALQEATVTAWSSYDRRGVYSVDVCIVACVFASEITLAAEFVRYRGLRPLAAGSPGVHSTKVGPPFVKGSMVPGE
jgi:hypothetical protein